MTNNPSYETALALVGMSGRFPGAQDVETFWRNIAGGVKAIRFFSDEELLTAGTDPDLLRRPNYVKAGAIVEDIERFDASFFGFTPREAEVMDPQHRLFLECAWEALECAGYSPETYQDSIGVFAGSAISTYLLDHIYPNPEVINHVSRLQVSIGNDRDSLASTVSYKLNLRGPSLAVQTFCSTSLVAVHLACQSLLNYECDIALAGGVAITLPQLSGYLYEEGGILSPDGECRTFDARGRGSVMGNGLGVVTLKRYQEAIEDGDYIYAVVLGSAFNNDGSQRVSYTAPGLDGQTGVIAEALGQAGVDIETISCIEAHGTATELGDTVELAAMMKAFATKTRKKQFCAIGSVKPNVGHLDRAAGVTGLIKTALALQHKQLPPSLNFESTSTDIDLENSPFYVNTHLREWDSSGTPRRAGVSSFGLGGTNVHMILEEAPERELSGPSRPWQLLLLSAKTETALQTLTSNLATHLKAHKEISLPDVAYTLHTGRNIFNYRRAVICRNREETIASLDSADPRFVFTLQEPYRDRPVAFLFPGLGEQYIGPARELYAQEPVFREAMRRCGSFLKEHFDLDIDELLSLSEKLAVNSSDTHPGSFNGHGQHASVDLRSMLGRNGKNGYSASTTDERLKQTAVAQPVLFVIEYALAQLFVHWGIRPSAMLGYSLGEYVAACLSGVLSLEDTLTLVTQRARLIQDLPHGAMVAVALPEKDVQTYLRREQQISLAAVNAPGTCVLAGPVEAIERLEKSFTQQEIACFRVETTHAFHSTMLESLREPLTALAQSVHPRPPEIPYISNVTGTWITNEQATDPAYWAEHMCRTVQFADGVTRLLENPDWLLLEIGPGQSLCSFVKLHPRCGRERLSLVLPSLPSVYDRQSNQAFLLMTLGKLWLAGVTVDWAGFYAHEHRYRQPLPTYPFERQRYWVEAKNRLSQAKLAGQATVPDQGKQAVSTATIGIDSELERIPDITDWFFLPSWKLTLSPSLFTSTDFWAEEHCWLAFVDTHNVNFRIVNHLRERGQRVITVLSGTTFGKRDEDTYTVCPTRRVDYESLFKDLRSRGKIPEHIVHLWTVSQPGEFNVHETLDRGYYSLLALAQVLGDLGLKDTYDISIISNEIQRVTGNEQLCPEKAAVIGPCRVIPQEYANMRCRSIDITLCAPDSAQEQALLNGLVEELVSESRDMIVALREGQRWVQIFEPVPLDGLGRHMPRIRERGVYLITGGLGGIGLAMAQYLAHTAQARLILTSRSGLPPREEWTTILETQGDMQGIGRQIRIVQELETNGTEVLVLAADVANETSMRVAIQQAQARFGVINGVLHTAAVPGVGLMQLKTPETAHHVLAPKIMGTLVLERVLGDLSLDFLALFSSMTSITGGGPGQVDYCAANAFLDAYACQHRTEHGMTVAIDWGEWQWNAWEDGLTGYDTAAQTFFRAHRQAFGISFEEGTEAFKRILSYSLPQVIVSTQDFRAFAELSKQFTAASILQRTQEGRQNQEMHPRPSLSRPYIEPRNELEKHITTVWEELLGISPVGIEDNFFDLGGNSLIGTELIARLRQAIHAEELAAHVLYEAPTVSALAQVVERGRTTVAVEEWQDRSQRRREGLRHRLREPGHAR